MMLALLVLFGLLRLWRLGILFRILFRILFGTLFRLFGFLAGAGLDVP